MKVMTLFVLPGLTGGGSARAADGLRDAISPSMAARSCVSSAVVSEVKSIFFFIGKP